MFKTITQTAAFGIMACFLLGALSACGGGGGGGSTPVAGGGGNYPLATPTGAVGGETPPFTFSPFDIDVIHMEMTDLHRRWITGGSNATEHGTVLNYADGDVWRFKMVCPGLSHNGNTCTTNEVEASGQVYRHRVGVIGSDAPPGDWSIRAYHEALRAGFPSLFDNPPSPGAVFSVDRIDGRNGGNVWGMRGDYAMYFVQDVLYPGLFRDYSSFAFGSLSSGRPEGPATWSGAMVGKVIANGGEVSGASDLVYDFSGQSLDLTFSRVAGSDYSGPATFGWEDLPLNSDASFYMPGHGNDNANADPHPTLGYVDGDLYGPNHEEFAGVFERYGMVGAFGSSPSVPEPRR